MGVIVSSETEILKDIQVDNSIMSNNERILKEDHILQCQDAFTQFSNKSGLVATKDLGNLLRALGINPTNEELQDMTIQIDPHVTGFLKLPDLLDMMSRIILERNYDAQIEDAFRCFDKNGIGTISRQDLHAVFENLGERLVEDEIEGLLEEADVENEGIVSYSDFCAFK